MPFTGRFSNLKPGSAGAPGTNGQNAFTTTTAQYIQPGSPGNINVQVLDTSWMIVGQTVFVEHGGNYTVVLISSGILVRLQNPGYLANAPATTIIPTGSRVSPSGTPAS